jgi:hypothetical protein
MKTIILEFKILQWMHRKVAAIEQNHQTLMNFMRISLLRDSVLLGP